MTTLLLLLIFTLAQGQEIKRYIHGKAHSTVSLNLSYEWGQLKASGGRTIRGRDTTWCESAEYYKDGTLIDSWRKSQ